MHTGEGVKLIYIDPPYNTGSDGFVYEDDRKFTPNLLAELSGVNLEEAERILDFTAKKSNSHSAWLTFMYPRLFIARELLQDDGVIFVSIDDNEQSQLKLLCDEIFGESNFIEQFLWNKSSGGSSLSKYTRNDFEYILCYARNINEIKDKLIGKIAEGSSDSSLINQPNKFNTLLFRSGVINFLSTDSGIIHKFSDNDFELYDDIIIKNGLNVNDVSIAAKWKWSQEYLDKNVASGTKVISKTDSLRLRYLKDFTGNIITPTKSITKNDGVGYTVSGTSEISTLFSGAVFDFPKPTSLIKYLTRMVTSKDSVILDFFAGLGTTAHAVMQLNVEDKGNRRFLCVQLPEKTDEKSSAFKAGYQTIFDITKARIEKAAEKIQSENPDYKGDLGFKIFETVPDFREIPDFNEEIENKRKNSITNLQAHLYDLDQDSDSGLDLTPEQIHTLLTTWRVYDGQALTDPVVNVNLNCYTAYLCSENLYLINPGFENTNIRSILDKLDNDKDFVIGRIFVYGDAISSARLQELKQALKDYQNRKSLEITLSVRY